MPIQLEFYFIVEDIEYCITNSILNNILLQQKEEKEEKRLLEIIKCFKNEWKGWSYISEYEVLTEKFMEKYIDKLDFAKVLKWQELSESFLEKHLLKYSNSNNYWFIISKWQELSEKFIKKYINKLQWKRIKKYQNSAISLLQTSFNF